MNGRCGRTEAMLEVCCSKGYGKMKWYRMPEARRKPLETRQLFLGLVGKFGLKGTHETIRRIEVLQIGESCQRNLLWERWT